MMRVLSPRKHRAPIVQQVTSQRAVWCLRSCEAACSSAARSHSSAAWAWIVGAQQLIHEKLRPSFYTLFLFAELIL